MRRYSGGQRAAHPTDSTHELVTKRAEASRVGSPLPTMESAAQPIAVEPLLQLRARDNAASLNGVEHERDTSGALDAQTELCVLAKRRPSEAK
ncbi:MAG: hypothetical protein EAZ43_05885 [Betaproteobacteria bacterium]|nr:MAG: hypothetical protein EAZ43_05885 [Betaproteobacteria bacterium]